MASGRKERKTASACVKLGRSSCARGSTAVMKAASLVQYLRRKESVETRSVWQAFRAHPGVQSTGAS